MSYFAARFFDLKIDFLPHRLKSLFYNTLQRVGRGGVGRGRVFLL